MDIKPLSSPAILPASGTALRDRVAEPLASPDPQLDHGTAASSPPAVAQDPAAQRIASDPWADTPVGDRLLMSQASAADGVPNLKQMSLPEAVRSAVDFVFTPTP